MKEVVILPWMTVEKLKLNNLDKCKKVYNIKKSTKLENMYIILKNAKDILKE